MSTISEFVEKLREKAAIFSKSDFAVAGIAKDYKEAADIIEKLAEEYKSNLSENITGWIACSERLPEAAGFSCLLTVMNKYGQIDVKKGFTNYMEGGKFAFYSNEKDFDINVWLVLAWQPLPEPYKQKEIPTDHYTERFNRVV